MKNVLVLGATGNVAQYFIDSFANVAPDDMQLTLWARNSRRLPRSQHEAYQFYEGDMYDATTLVPAIADADIIVSFIGSSPMPTYAQALIDAINMSGRTIDRVIWLGTGSATMPPSSRAAISRCMTKCRSFSKSSATSVFRTST